MRKLTLRGLLVAALLSVSAVLAAPAQATLTPVNTVVRATSTNFQSQKAAGIVVRCPDVQFTGTIDATGRSISGTMTFRSSGGVTCVMIVLGVPFSVTITCRGTFTLASTASVSRVSAFGSASLDRNLECVDDVPALRCNVRITGPQGPFANALSFNQATQVLDLDLRGARDTSSGPACGPGGTVSFDGTFTVTSGRITVS